MKKVVKSGKLRAPLETYIQDMYSKVQQFNESEYRSHVEETHGQLGSRLVLMRQKISASQLNHQDELEYLAQEVSHGALALGASNLLDVAIQFQGAVRGKHAGLVDDLLLKMEEELAKVSDYLDRSQKA